MFKAKSTETARQDHAFGHRDRLGREIGASIWLHTVDVTEGATPRPYDHANLWWPSEPGRYFAVDFAATRDRMAYGASQPRWHYHTEAERAAHVARYLKQAAKAAAKRAGR
jgi:hypothetical protein